MSSFQQEPWSSGPNAPKISHRVYREEKAYFAGVLIAAILYGIVIVMFFQCMFGLLNPLHRKREGIKWGIVAYTLALFTFVTVYTGMNLNIESISYVDNREFPGIQGMIPSGPLGYRSFVYSDALSIVPNVMFFLNNWLADAFLLHRCYIIYARNPWVIGFPFLMYLASVGTGILVVHQMSQPVSSTWGILLLKYSVPWISISVSLNVLLTFVIVLRLFLSSRSVRTATGSPYGISGLYVAVATMLIESCALYTVNSLVLIGLWVTNNAASGAFLVILSEIQAIAPLLIIKRIADRSAVTSDAIVPVPSSQFNIRSGGESTGGSTLLSHFPMNYVGKYETNAAEPTVGDEAVIDLRRDSEVRYSGFAAS